MDLLDVARRWAAVPAAWPVPPRFDPAQRWYARLAAPADHEVWLLTWLPGQHTDLHDHGGSAGAFVVVSGCLIEETLTRGRRGAGAACGPRGCPPAPTGSSARATCTGSPTTARTRRSACTSTRRRCAA